MLEHFLQPELLWRRDLCSPPTVSAAGDVHAAYSEMGQTGAKKGELAVTSQAAGGVFAASKCTQHSTQAHLLLPYNAGS